MQNGIVILQHIPDIKNAAVPQPVGDLFILEAIFVSVVCEPQNHLESKTSESHLLTKSTARHSPRANMNPASGYGSF